MPKSKANTWAPIWDLFFRCAASAFRVEGLEDSDTYQFNAMCMPASTLWLANRLKLFIAKGDRDLDPNSAYVIPVVPSANIIPPHPHDVKDSHCGI